MKTLFTSAQVLKAVSITYRQLSYWELKGIVKPTYQKLGCRNFKRYTQQDIDTLKTVKRLLDQGYSLPATDTLKEISKREEAEKALGESKEKYRSLIENIPDVIWTGDNKGNTTFISPNIEEIYGYTPEEMYKAGERLWFGRIHPDDLKRVKEAYGVLFEGGEKFDIEYRIMRKDGEWLWLHDRSVATYEKDGIRYADGIFSDITERKKVKEALAKSEERFRTLTESTSDWIWEIDRKSVYTYASPKVEELLGYKSEEVVGRTPFNLMPPQEAQRVAAEFGAIVESKRPFARLENINQHKDGRLVVLETSGVPVFDAAGNFRGYRGIDRDISERKKAEEKKEKLNHELSERIKELRCLYGLFKFIEKPDISLEKVFQEMVKLLPSGWQYPDITCARIVFKDKEFKTNEFKVSNWRQSANINMHGRKAGFIEVHYLEEKPRSYEGPFLKEERDLIEAIAQRLGRVAERKRTERESALCFEIFRVFRQYKSLKDICERIIFLIREYLNCDAVALRLKEEDDYPYFVNDSFPQEFIESENYLCIHDQKGNCLKDSRGRSILACMCGIIINAEFNLDKPFFTKGGSFWTNSTTALLASTTAEDRGATTRNLCNQYGYESVALIPVKSKRDNIGLIHIVDKRQNFFSSDSVNFLEELGCLIGMITEHEWIEKILLESENECQKFLKDSGRKVAKFIRLSQDKNENLD